VPTGLAAGLALKESRYARSVISTLRMIRPRLVSILPTNQLVPPLAVVKDHNDSAGL